MGAADAPLHRARLLNTAVTSSCYEPARCRTAGQPEPCYGPCIAPRMGSLRLKGGGGGDATTAQSCPGRQESGDCSTAGRLAAAAAEGGAVAGA
jgi:hypothetical protein